MGWAAGLNGGGGAWRTTASARGPHRSCAASRGTRPCTSARWPCSRRRFLDEHGRFRLDDARGHVAEHLHRWPALRRRVQPVPFGQGRPVWVDDAGFDLAYHVRLAALPRPGREEQLHALMARLQALPLDRRRPLWELWFVDGVQGDRVAVVQKTHLALAHELGAVGALGAVLDAEPRVPPLEVPAWTVRKAPNNAALLRAPSPRRSGDGGARRATLRGPRRRACGRTRSRATVEIGSHLRYEIVRGRCVRGRNPAGLGESRPIACHSRRSRGPATSWARACSRPSRRRHGQGRWSPRSPDGRMVMIGLIGSPSMLQRATCGLKGSRPGVQRSRRCGGGLRGRLRRNPFRTMGLTRVCFSSLFALALVLMLVPANRCPMRCTEPGQTDQPRSARPNPTPDVTDVAYVAIGFDNALHTRARACVR